MITVMFKWQFQSCPLLSSLGKQITFETAVGMNGRIWVKSR